MTCYEQEHPVTRLTWRTIPDMIPRMCDAVWQITKVLLKIAGILAVIAMTIVIAIALVGWIHDWSFESRVVLMFVTLFVFVGYWFESIRNEIRERKSNDER
jgi:hypothetical protein